MHINIILYKITCDISIFAIPCIQEVFGTVVFQGYSMRAISQGAVERDVWHAAPSGLRAGGLIPSLAGVALSLWAASPCGLTV
jgi:hypothetical protein